MGAIEDTIRSVPEERIYVGFLSIAAGLYAVYLSTQLALNVSAAFGGIVVILGIVLFTPHSHLVDTILEPMLGAAGLTMVIPYVRVLLDNTGQAADPAVVGLLAFGVLLLATSIVSLVYGQDK